MLAARLLVALLALAPCSFASGFDARRVSADAAWVLHVDFEALSRSTLLGSLHEAGQRVENELDADEITSSFGLDPFADVDSMTMYAEGFDSTDKAIVVIGNAKLDATWKRLAEKATREKIAGHDALRREHGASFPYVCLLPAKDAARRVGVLATSSATLEHALSVLDGGSSSLATGSTRGKPSLQCTPAIGSLVYAASSNGDVTRDRTGFFERALTLFTELSCIRDERKQTIARTVHAIEFDLSETHGEVAMRLSLDAATTAEGAHLEQVLREPIAALLASAGAPDVCARRKSVLDALKIEASASRLLVGFRYSASQFVEDVLFVEKNGVAPRR